MVQAVGLLLISTQVPCKVNLKFEKPTVISPRSVFSIKNRWNYWQKNRQLPGVVLMAWTVARPAMPPVKRVRTTRPMNTRRRNFASAAIVVELIRNSTTPDSHICESRYHPRISLT